MPKSSFPLQKHENPNPGMCPLQMFVQLFPVGGDSCLLGMLLEAEAWLLHFDSRREVQKVLK